MTIIFIKLFIGVALFGTLVALTVLQIPHAERLIDLIYASLIGLGITHLASPAPATSSKEGGFAQPGLLLAIALGSVLMVTGCATNNQGPPTSQAMRVTYTQACAAYGAAFAGALELRRAGKLNKAQIDQITLLDSQITPICTGPLPADPTAATQQVTAAVTAMVILEAVHKEQR